MDKSTDKPKTSSWGLSNPFKSKEAKAENEAEIITNLKKELNISSSLTGDDLALHLYDLIFTQETRIKEYKEKEKLEISLLQIILDDRAKNPDTKPLKPPESNDSLMGSVTNSAKSAYSMYSSSTSPSNKGPDEKSSLIKTSMISSSFSSMSTSAMSSNLSASLASAGNSAFSKAVELGGPTAGRLMDKAGTVIKILFFNQN
jgi:hypothetical protein